MGTKKWNKRDFTEMNNVQQKGHSHNNSLTLSLHEACSINYEGWNFNSGNYLFTTDKK